MSWQESFYSKISSEADENGCVLWLGARNNKGYGTFWRNGKRELAHRLAWELERGPIPDGLNVLHRCDRPLCVRVQHLFLGTQKDNIADCIAKGRKADTRGENSAQALLTEKEAQEIKWLLLEGFFTQREIGEAYGVATGTVANIKHGRHWSWVLPLEPTKLPRPIPTHPLLWVRPIALRISLEGDR